MSNIQIESDLKDILNRFEQKLDNLQKDVTELKIGQTEIKGDVKRLDSDISTLKENIQEIKGSQKAQIWTLISILITAVGGFIVAVAKVVFFSP